MQYFIMNISTRITTTTFVQRSSEFCSNLTKAVRSIVAPLNHDRTITSGETKGHQQGLHGNENFKIRVSNRRGTNRSRKHSIDQNGAETHVDRC